MVRNFLLALFAVLISVTLIIPQNKVGTSSKSAEYSPYKSQPVTTSRAMWDLQLSFDLNVATGAAGNAGAEFDGTYFYSTRWASNLIHKYDLSGNLIEEFSIPGVSGLRDLAFDGTYMYGGAAANTIYQMDFNTKTLIGTIPSPVAVRFIAYDEASDAFWCGTWSDSPTLVSRSGQNLGSFSTGLAGQYGAAYDPYSPNGPSLWIFDQGGGVCPGSMIMYEYNIASGTATGVSYDACSDLTDGIAGGLWTAANVVPGYFSIGGVMQSNSGLDDTYFVYELYPLCDYSPASNPTPANGAVDISVDLAQISWTNPAGMINNDLYFGTSGNLTLVQSGTGSSWNISPLPLEYNTTYIWQVVEHFDTCDQASSFNFTTEQNPSLQVLFFDDFENGTGLWTITNDGGTCVWEIFFPPYPNAYTLPCGTDCNGVFAADVDECGSGTTLLSSAMITDPIDASTVTDLTLEFDNDFNAIGASDEGYVEVSTDNGATWNTVWSSIGVDILNTHEVVDLGAYEGTIFKLRFRSVQPGWDWWWTIDNVKIQGATGPIGPEFTDNFDTYTVGEQLACQNPTDWTTWNLTPCDPTTDAYISDNYSWTPDNTVVIAQNNDLVHVFDAAGPLTSGNWYISFIAYIPTGKAGYFNTLALFDGGISPDWAVECYFDAGGAGRLISNSTVFANFNWPQATWFQVIVQVDLDSDQAIFMMATNPDDLTEVATWQWTTGGGGTHPLSLDANDFYGATAGDEMYVDNYYFKGIMPEIIPVELTSFTADVNNGNVVLNWQTASETNNRGFEVQKNSGSGFNTIGFVQGNGTSTQAHNYSFIDKAVVEGNYSYRLKQFDFDGTSAYSNTVEVQVVAPKVYALEQNYPNPFNPSTQINFSLAADSKISLKVYNILGQEITTLFAGDMAAGSHFVTFDASKLSSGVYIYKLEANGVDGSKFNAIKKMVLTK